MKLEKLFLISLLLLFSFFSCKTTDLENDSDTTIQGDETIKSKEAEEEQNEEELHQYLIEEELKVQDIEPTVIYIDKPVYVPEKDYEEEKKLKGYDAVWDSQSKATITPENYKNGTFYYTYNENFVYEIYAQPLHLTDIILEDGEVVMGNLHLSEDESVWELTADVARNPITGDNIQHLFIKPACAGLDSTFIVVTDRRVYHMRLKSFKSVHMAMVKFTYPGTRNIFSTSAKGSTNGVSTENEYITISNPEFLSFDYKMKYGFNKPEFLPKRVYDDGNRTYIVVDDIVLHKELPLVFNERNEIVNYVVQKNVFIIPRLINRITLRLGKEKVIIEKKKSKEQKDDDKHENKTKNE